MFSCVKGEGHKRLAHCTYQTAKRYRKNKVATKRSDRERAVIAKWKTVNQIDAEEKQWTMTTSMTRVSSEQEVSFVEYPASYCRSNNTMCYCFHNCKYVQLSD